MPRVPSLLLIAGFAACAGSKPADRGAVDTTLVYSATPAAGPEDAVLRLIVTGDPRVYAGGQAATLTRLDSLLDTLKGAGGEVWLYREASDPHVAAQQDALVDSVLAAIARRELTVRLSRKPDFSDQHRRRPRPDRP